MNKEYIQTTDQIIVSTDIGLQKRERLNNTKEILETENNIEEIENIQNNIQEANFFNYKSILDFFTNKYIKKIITISLPIILIIVFGTILSTNPYISLLTVPTIIIGGVIPTTLSSFFAMYKAKKTTNLIHEKANEMVTENLEKEKQKLEQLNKESTILEKKDFGFIDKSIKINKSELIKDLKRKLELIKDYELNKKRYIKLIKKNSLITNLKNNGYSGKDITFLYSLIKNDCDEKASYSIKTLKLKK